MANKQFNLANMCKVAKIFEPRNQTHTHGQNNRQLSTAIVVSLKERGENLHLNELGLIPRIWRKRERERERGYISKDTCNEKKPHNDGLVEIKLFQVVKL